MKRKKQNKKQEWQTYGANVPNSWHIVSNMTLLTNDCRKQTMCQQLDTTSGTHKTWLSGSYTMWCSGFPNLLTPSSPSPTLFFSSFPQLRGSGLCNMFFPLIQLVPYGLAVTMCLITCFVFTDLQSFTSAWFSPELLQKKHIVQYFTKISKSL